MQLSPSLSIIVPFLVTISIFFGAALSNAIVVERRSTSTYTDTSLTVDTTNVTTTSLDNASTGTVDMLNDELQLYQNKGLCRRWAHQSVIKDDKLYLYGGQMLIQTDYGVETKFNNDNLIFLDLNGSFPISKGSIPWKTRKPGTTSQPPSVSEGGFFPGPAGLYLYDGQVAATANEQESSIWSYDLGTSTWEVTDELANDDQRFPKRYSRGIGVTAPGGDVGYYIGGLRAYANATYKGWYYPTDNQMVTIDLKRGKVLKRSKLPMGQKRLGLNAVYLPVGQEGIIVMIGGTEEYKLRETGAKVDAGEPRLNPMSQMSTIWIYSIADEKWFYQTATGDPGNIPWERKNFCMVPVTSSKNTHHIYIYGGSSDYKSPMFMMNDTTYGDMYILNIPSFRYTLVQPQGSAPHGRQRMTCHVVDNRQMLVLGGHSVNSSAVIQPGKETCKWDEMHLLDMSKLQWMKGYLPTGNNYTVPDVVLASIGQNTTSPVLGWDDERLKEVFAVKPGDLRLPVELLGVRTIKGEYKKKMKLVVGVSASVTFLVLCSTAFLLRRRRMENEAIKHELEQIHQYILYLTTGEVYDSRRMSDLSASVDRGGDGSKAFVSETSRPMTFSERIKFSFGLLKRGKQKEIRTLYNYPLEKPPIPVEQIP